MLMRQKEPVILLADHMRINTFALLRLEQRMEMILLLLLLALVMVYVLFQYM